MFFVKDGILHCKYKNYIIQNLNAKLLYKGTKYNILQIESANWEVVDGGKKAVSKLDDCEFVLCVKNASGGISLTVDFVAHKNFQPKNCHHLVINGILPVKPESLTYNSTSVYGRVHDFEMGCGSFTTGLVKNQKEEGSQYMGFKCSVNGAGGYYGVIGFVTFEHYFGEIEFAENGEFSIISTLNDELVENNVKSDNCCICIERGNADILSWYGRQIARQNNVVKRVEIPTGWCSWYYYGSEISAEIIAENMAYIKKYNLPVKYIQIDDGWQKCSGNWEANEKFACGMKGLADEIKANGFIPGIWIAPFVFEPESKVFDEHPEYFVKTPDGRPDPNRLVDYSVKGAREWLYNVAHKISWEWGYRYIKIDLVSWRLAISGYKKKGFNAVKNFRTAIKTIRSAVTPDTVLLTCTSPIGASAGVADCVRISDDIFERWESLKAIAKQILKRYYINEYINIDPDCLMVRTADKHDEQAFRICVRNQTEIKTFINFMSAAGGALMLSDKFALLDDGDIEKIRTLFPINEWPAKPLDLFERNIPSILYYGKKSGLDMYALFNWENCVDTLSVDFGKQKYVKCYYSKNVTKTDKFELTLEAHDSEIIYVADDENDFSVLTSAIMPE